jgi:prepilin-type N-terminal cleavage/methylation domain-containing protein
LTGCQKPLKRLSSSAPFSTGLKPGVNESRNKCPASGLDARAFTLIEIMIVVAIIGLIAAMGLPAIGKALQKEGMRLAVSDFTDVCFKAREMAIVNNRTTAVVIYPHERRFGVEGTTMGEARTLDTHSGKVTASTLPAGVEFGMVDVYRREYVLSDWAKIFFHADGTCDEAVIVLLYKGQSQKITLEYATGMPTATATDQ